jgi:hypothetical protein
MLGERRRRIALLLRFWLRRHAVARKSEFDGENSAQAGLVRNGSS